MALSIKWAPEKILTDFLRAYVTEPTRADYSARQVSDTETFNGDDVTKTFTLTNLPYAIVSVAISSVGQKKYVAFDYDLRAKTVTFATAPATGTNNVSITYIKTGTWVYPNKPRVDLGDSSYPRIAIFSIDDSGEAMGMYDNDRWDTWTVQINILTKKDLKLTVGGLTYTDADVVSYINQLVQSAIRTKWRDELCGVLFYPIKISSGVLPYDEDKGIFTRTIRYNFNAVNLGEYPGV